MARIYSEPIVFTDVKDGAGMGAILSSVKVTTDALVKTAQTQYGVTPTASVLAAFNTAYQALKDAEAAGSIDYSSQEPAELTAFNTALTNLNADVASKTKSKYDEKPTLASIKTDLAKTTSGTLGAIVNTTVESNTKIAKKADLDAQAAKINSAIQMIDKETSNWPDSDVAPNPITDAGLTAAQIYNLRSTTYPYTEWGEDADPVAWCNRHLGDMYHVGAAKGSAGNEHTGKSFSFKKVSGTNNYTWIQRMDNEGIKAYKELQEVTKPGGTLDTLEATVKQDSKTKADAAKAEAISAAATDAQSKVTAAKTELNTAIGKKVDTTTFNTEVGKKLNTADLGSSMASVVSGATPEATTVKNAVKDAMMADDTVVNKLSGINYKVIHSGSFKNGVGSVHCEMKVYRAGVDISADYAAYTQWWVGPKGAKSAPTTGSAVATGLTYTHTDPNTTPWGIIDK